MKTESIKIGQKDAKLFISYNLQLTPVVPVAYRAAAELMENKLAFNYPLIEKDQSVLWLELESKIIGFLIFEKSKLGLPNVVRIVMSWVSEEFRGQGIRGILEQNFVEILKQSSAEYIETEIHIDNISIEKALTKLGYKTHFLKKYKKL